MIFVQGQDANEKIMPKSYTPAQEDKTTTLPVEAVHQYLLGGYTMTNYHFFNPINS
jgi:hypothetical protein